MALEESAERTVEKWIQAHVLKDWSAISLFYRFRSNEQTAAKRELLEPAREVRFAEPTDPVIDGYNARLTLNFEVVPEAPAEEVREFVATYDLTYVVNVGWMIHEERIEERGS